MEINFVCAGAHYFEHPKGRLGSFIRKGLKKYKIKKVMVTKLVMKRQKLITKEEMEKYCKREKRVSYHSYDIRDTTQSVNDDLDSLFEVILLGKKLDEVDLNWTHFIPELTDEELKLVEKKDKNFMNTFNTPNPDVKKAEMQASKSDSKFVFAVCGRQTFTIKNLKRKTSSLF